MCIACRRSTHEKHNLPLDRRRVNPLSERFRRPIATKRYCSTISAYDVLCDVYKPPGMGELATTEVSHLLRVGSVRNKEMLGRGQTEGLLTQRQEQQLHGILFLWTKFSAYLQNIVNEKHRKLKRGQHVSASEIYSTPHSSATYPGIYFLFGTAERAGG